MKSEIVRFSRFGPAPREEMRGYGGFFQTSDFLNAFQNAVHRHEFNNAVSILVCAYAFFAIKDGSRKSADGIEKAEKALKDRNHEKWQTLMAYPEIDHVLKKSHELARVDDVGRVLVGGNLIRNYISSNLIYC